MDKVAGGRIEVDDQKVCYNALCQEGTVERSFSLGENAR